MQGKVEICGVNTARLKTLTHAEMDTLLRLAKAGDKKAREKLIEGNLRLVLSVIQRFDKRGESPDDLSQVGCIGLMKAIANFDPDKQVKFSTYGVPMIVESRNIKKGVSTYDKKASNHQGNRCITSNRRERRSHPAASGSQRRAAPDPLVGQIYPGYCGTVYSGQRQAAHGIGLQESRYAAPHGHPEQV